MTARPKILIVDDEPVMLRYLRTVLESESYSVEAVSSGAEAVAHVRENKPPDVILLDVAMPDVDGLQTLELLHKAHPGLKVIMLSCLTEPRKIVQAMRLGAVDYLTKPFQISDLKVVINHCLKSQRRAAATEGQAPGTIVEELDEGVFFLAGCPAMLKVSAEVDRVANVDVPVLLLGESGTGKEVVARLIHKRSLRGSRTFLKVNCAALPADLLESELFGYEAGAFTGASRSKPGKFELSDQGTFLLDEIGEMPASLQAKLLHVLQDGEFSRLGSRTTTKVDVRVLAATNLKIEEAIAAKKFREDLYYRLNAFTIHLPPLRERKEEIPLHLIQAMARYANRYSRTPLPLTPGLVNACVRYSWPGNLRELQNFVKRYLILGDESLVRSELEAKSEPVASDAPVAGASAAETGTLRGGLKSLVRSVKDEAEIEAISRALEQTRWNRKRAAGLLNISYKALLYKIRQYGIEQ